jgi:hypothetical protein
MKANHRRNHSLSDISFASELVDLAHEHNKDFKDKKRRSPSITSSKHPVASTNSSFQKYSQEYETSDSDSDSSIFEPKMVRSSVSQNSNYSQDESSSLRPRGEKVSLSKYNKHEAPSGLLRSMSIYYVDEYPIISFNNVAVSEKMWLYIRVSIKDSSIISCCYEYCTPTGTYSEDIWNSRIVEDLLTNMKGIEKSLAHRITSHIDRLSSVERIAILREYHNNIRCNNLKITEDELLAAGFLLGLVSFLVWYVIHENGHSRESPLFTLPLSSNSGRIFCSNLMLHLIVPLAAIGRVCRTPMGALSRTANTFVNIWSSIFISGQEFCAAKMATQVVTGIAIIISSALSETTATANKIRHGLTSLENKILTNLKANGVEIADLSEKALETLKEKHVSISDSLCCESTRIHDNISSFASSLSLMQCQNLEKINEEGSMFIRELVCTSKQVQDVINCEIRDLTDNVEAYRKLINSDQERVIELMESMEHSARNNVVDTGKRVITEVSNIHSMIIDELRQYHTEITDTLNNGLMMMTTLDRSLETKMQRNSRMVDELTSIVNSMSVVDDSKYSACLQRISVLEACVLRLTERDESEEEDDVVISDSESMYPSSS